MVNITDVDDKLIAEANRRGMKMSEVAAEMTEDYMSNLRAMGIDTIDHFPRATEHMAGIIQFTQDLIARGFAYASDGDVISTSPRTRNTASSASGASRACKAKGETRRSVSGRRWTLPCGRAPSRASRPGTAPGDRGGPGWHIECSAMSRKLLGESFDIHGGGLDLMFPHHENEIAQSECCHGKPQARYWMHNGLLQKSTEVGKLGGRNTRDAKEGDWNRKWPRKSASRRGRAPSATC